MFSFTEVRMTHTDYGEAQGFFKVALEHTHSRWLLCPVGESVKALARRLWLGFPVNAVHSE